MSAQFRDWPILSYRTKEYRHSEIRSLYEPLLSKAGRVDRLAVAVSDGPLSLAAVLLAVELRLDAVLTHAELSAERACEVGKSASCSHILSGSLDDLSLALSELPGTQPVTEPWRRDDARLAIMTSGSTGEPKIIPRLWQSLIHSVAVRAELAETRWLSLYPLTRFAGLNVMMHALLNHSTLIVPESHSLSDCAAALCEGFPTHVSGTPSLWRSLMMHLGNSDRKFASVRQVSLGGEPVDQLILSMLARAFPEARITHIYASTEHGVILSVSDGQAGFPAGWIGDPSRRVRLEVNDGELVVGCGGAAPDSVEWSPTGDLIEVRGERAYFVGRKTDIVNIGGAKVAPVEVESCLLSVPGVRQALVRGVRNPISGRMLAAEIVADDTADPAALRRLLFEHCKRTLPNHAVPRKIDFVSQISLSQSGKTVR